MLSSLQESSFLVNSPGIVFVSAYTIGYFWYVSQSKRDANRLTYWCTGRWDFVLMHVFTSAFWRVDNFFHHFVGACFFPLAFVYNAGHFFIAFILINEASNPFLNLRYQVQHHARTYSLGLALCVLFVFEQHH